jgi:hypothetical protein
MNTLDRAKNILLDPKREWTRIQAEPTSIAELYKEYIAVLAAIGPIASVIGLSLFGITLPFVGTVRLPLTSSLTQALVTYILTLGGVFLLGLIVDALAPLFNGVPNRTRAVKVVAYASTAAWVAGIFTVIPALSVMALLASLYSLYLLYLGLPVLMKVPQQKALGYTVTVILAAIVLFVGIGAVSSSLIPSPASVALNPDTESVQDMQEAANRLADALKPEATSNRELRGSGNASTSTKTVTVDFRQLKGLLPETLRGFKRTAATGDHTEAFGMTLSKAEGTYQSPEAHIVEVTISDIGSLSAVTTIATYTWTSTSFDRETETGYEKTTNYQGYKAYEKYDKADHNGEITVMVKDRFVVEVKGNPVNIDELRTVLDQIDLGKLAAMTT